MPTASAWAPDPRDVQPEVKLTATRLVEAFGTWGPGQSGEDAARARVSALGQDPGLVAAVGSAMTGAAAALQVIDAQYGGILDRSASVLVSTRNWVRDATGAVVAGGATYDVRLVAASPTWRVTEIHPSMPGPASPSLSGVAQEVLSSQRIDLPPASSADVASGQVHDSVLKAMLRLAETYVIGVSVVRSGHPIHVFGTTRLSDHPRGRAFDTWRIDGQAVVAGATPRSLVTAYMRDAAAAGSYNVGGPYALSGSAFFTDDTHHDHVHAGFRA